MSSAGRRAAMHDARPLRLDGRRRQLRHGGFATRTDAIDERDHIALLLRQAHGDPPDARRIADIVQQTLRAGKPLPDIDAVAGVLDTRCPAVHVPTAAEYLTTWLADLPVDANTLRGYESHVRCHLIPHLGNLPLDELNAHHITTITHHDPDGVPPKRSHGRWTGPSTCHRILATLHNALAHAVDQHLIPDNPADHVHLPAAPRPKPRLWTDERVRRWQATGHIPGPVMVWTPQQTGAFLDHAQTAEPDLYPMWHLMAYRGLRRGEALGLLDADTELDNGQLFITNQITTLGWKLQSKPPKTSAGDRFVVLDTATTQTLRAYRAQQATRWATADPPWPDTGLFFTQPDGTPWHPGVVQHRFKLCHERGGELICR
jgi:integrase